MSRRSNLKLTNIEILSIIVLVAIVIIGGVTLFSIITKNRELSNFKEDVKSLSIVAKNSYNAFVKSGLGNYVITSTDGSTKGMCITLKGLKENDYLTRDYSKWDGYIVIEEMSEDKYHYGLWLTNGKYVIDGYDLNLLEELSLEKGISKYNNEEFSSKVKNNFTGISSKNGGTGSVNGTLKTYEKSCIDERIS